MSDQKLTLGNTQLTTTVSGDDLVWVWRNGQLYASTISNIVIGNYNTNQLPSNTILSNTSGVASAPAPNTISSILDHYFSPTSGDILVRGASAWQVISAGATGYALASTGPGLAPSYQFVPNFTPIAGGAILANTTGVPATPTASTLTAVLDTFGTTQGSIIWRGATAWGLMNPGVAGQMLKTQGAGADPVWAELTLGNYLPSRTNAVARSVSGKLDESFSVVDFGADPTGTSDSYTAFVNAISVISANGSGELYIPRGTYKISSQLSCPSYLNIYGDGPNASVLDFATATSGYGLSFVGPNKYVINIKDIGVLNAYNSNIHFDTANLISVENVTSKFSRHGHGIYTVNTWQIAIKRCDFWQNLLNGGKFLGPTTSLSVVDSYANLNGVSGWYVDECVYSSFVTAASDAAIAGYGYQIRNIGGISFIGCGAEINGNGAWVVEASTAIGTGKTIQDIRGVVLVGCCTVDNGTSAAYYSSFLEASSLNSKTIEVTLLECYDYSSHNGISILVDAGSPAIRRIGGTYAGTVNSTVVDIGTEAGRLTYLDAASFAANGSVATAMSSVGPTGAHTTVQEWLKINHGGTPRYIPMF